MEWIKCSDRLPRDDGYYLTFNEMGFYHVHSWCEGWNCHRSCDGSAYKKFEFDDIIAWQPIEQFKEE